MISEYEEAAITTLYDIKAYHNNSDWPVVVSNLQRSQRKWGRFSLMLVWDYNYTRTYDIFYVEVFQSVLHFGSESWVIIPRILRVMGDFIIG